MYNIFSKKAREEKKKEILLAQKALLLRKQCQEICFNFKKMRRYSEVFLGEYSFSFIRKISDKELRITIDFLSSLNPIVIYTATDSGVKISDEYSFLTLASSPELEFIRIEMDRLTKIWKDEYAKAKEQLDSLKSQAGIEAREQLKKDSLEIALEAIPESEKEHIRSLVKQLESGQGKLLQLESEKEKFKA